MANPNLNILTQNSKIIPITRINKFFSEEDFELEISMGREAIEGDGNFTVILYKVDRTQTQFDELYGESPLNGIRYFPPIELKVIPILAEPENKAYNKDGTARYLQDGQITLGIYESQLIEENTDIDYGDYIGYPTKNNELRYYSVSNDGKKNFDNKHTIMGYKGAFRTIICSPIDYSEFKGV
jgi:hypothetical protein